MEQRQSQWSRNLEDKNLRREGAKGVRIARKAKRTFGARCPSSSCSHHLHHPATRPYSSSPSRHRTTASPPVPDIRTPLRSHTMSRRAAVVEEEFDDDTDLPLPNKPLPNTGTRGAILEELDISEDEDDVPTLREPHAGPASPSLPQFRAGTGADPSKTVTDLTPYKKYVPTSHPKHTRCRACVPRAGGNNWTLSSGGHASTPYTSMRSVRVGQASGA